MKTVFLRRIPLPKFKKGSGRGKNKTYKEVLVTLNNTSQWIRYSQTKIKNEYKQILREFYFPEPEKEYEKLTIDYRIIRNSRRTLDKDNVVWALKWIADTLEEIGYIKNDQNVNFRSFDTILDKSSSETLLEIRVLEGSDRWEDHEQID